MTLRARFVALMDTRGLQAWEVAEALDVSIQYVRMLRAGQRQVTAQHVADLEKYAGIEPAEGAA